MMVQDVEQVEWEREASRANQGLLGFDYCSSTIGSASGGVVGLANDLGTWRNSIVNRQLGKR